MEIVVFLKAKQPFWLREPFTSDRYAASSISKIDNLEEQIPNAIRNPR
jgi:hypothetical protein